MEELKNLISLVDSRTWGTIIGTAIFVVIILALRRVRPQFKVAFDKPILEFHQEEVGWSLRNVASEPAFNIRLGELGFNDINHSHNFNHPRFLLTSALTSENLIRLRNQNGTVLKTAHVLVAIYKDEKEREYLTYCRSNTNHRFQKVRFFRWRGNKQFSRDQLTTIYEHLQNGPTNGHFTIERY